MLLGDGAAVLAYPFPYPRNEGLAPDFLPGLSLFGELPFDDDLSCNACVVAAREPEGWVAHHAMPADERVLGGSGQCVAEVEFTRNVGWGHDDDERLLTLFYGWGEVAVVEPKFVDAAFDLGGVVDLWDAGEVFSAGGHG